MLPRLAAFAIASLGLVACGGAATTGAGVRVRGPSSARGPVAPAAADPAKASTITVSPAAAGHLTPEDALLARLDQLQKVDFLRGAGGNGPRRPRVVPTAFKIADLPVARLFAPPVVEDYKPMQKSPPGQPPKLGSIDPDIVITPQDPKEKIVAGQIRTIRIGLRETPTKEGRGAGLVQLAALENLRRGANVGNAKELSERCGESFTYDRWVPIRWSRVFAGDDGLHVAVGDVVFDRVACSVHTVQHVETKAAQLVPGGVMYGFLGCGESCQVRESLVIAMPRANNAASASLGGDPEEQIGTFSLIEIPIEHGGGASLVTLVTGGDVGAWHTALMGQALPSSSRNEVMGVEVTQSVRDAAPLAIAYVEARDTPAADPARINIAGKLIDLDALTTR